MSQVEVIAYGDEAHVYPAGSDAAEVLYTVAIGANLDAERFRVPARRWREALADPRLGSVTVHDHTADGDGDGGAGVAGGQAGPLTAGYDAPTTPLEEP